MAQRSFSVRIEDSRVFVKHRVPAALAAVAGLGLTAFGVLFLPGNLHTLAAARAAGDFFSGFKAVLGMCLPLLGIWLWLFMLHAGEVLECDATELHHARQRMWGYWRRRRFPSSGIRALQIEMRSGGRSRYHLLTFHYEAEKIDALMGISPADAEQILQACRSIGIDAQNTTP